MDDRLNNDPGGSVEPANGVQVKVQDDSCAKCNKNPCVCPISEGIVNKEKPLKTTPPKISWI